MSQIKTIGVIGAGQMGAGIAQVSAQAGYQTILFDSVAPALNKGMALIGSLLEKAVTKEKITTAERSSILERLSPASELTALKDCDLVIEAIIENSDVKTKLFSELDAIVKPSAILASNTSSISITKIAASTKRPGQVIGMHFMNPVPVMKLVEIIRGLQTSDHTYQIAQQVSLQMGKTTVLAIDSAGFVVNRILVPMINEAIFLLQEGVKAEDIDTAMKLGTNQPMGPLELADFVGLDTLLYIMQVLHKELGEDKYRPCPLLVKYIEAGWYGKKSGRGFYQY
jgi:3-hydroxybutyryl-CoA dehydrogenase